MPTRALESSNRQSSTTVKQSAWETGSNALVKVRLLCFPCYPAINEYLAGGWDPQTGVFEKEINAQIDLAFSNVELNLHDAGGKGWSQVFRVNSYHVPLNTEALDAMVSNPKHGEHRASLEAFPMLAYVLDLC